MTWMFDAPLVTMSDQAKNERDAKLWEAEDLGGLTEDNNRVPVPIVWLLLLTVLTAFAITFPLWGQRPNAELYVNYVKAMDDPEVKAAANDKEAMAKIVAKYQKGPDEALLERHPLTMDQLRMIAPQIKALEEKQKTDKDIDLRDYNIVGPNVVMANFEGNFRADGTRIRQQPWWDKGYTIDVFYVIAFFVGVTITIKRLPPSTWQPRHGGEHK
jgi:hypothetical protein